MGGNSSTGYNPAYDTCAVGFTHSECEPYALFAPYTVCTVHTGCILYADCDPLHSCVLYSVCVVYAAHATHLACAPYAASYTYAVCALYTFFQLILMIRHSKSDFSLLLVLVMSPLSLHTILCMHVFTYRYFKLFPNYAFTGEKYARKVCDIKVTCFSFCNMTLKDKIKLHVINVVGCGVTAPAFLNLWNYTRHTVSCTCWLLCLC